MIYNTIFNKLVKIGIITKDGKPAFDEYLKLKSGAFMDLNIDFLYEEDDRYTIAIAHNYIQNGDVMADPDMEISIIPEMKMAEALTFRQDGAFPRSQQIYSYDENGVKLVRPKLKTELNKFLNMWLGNIKKQGFKNPA
ncbi:hypothetical protein C5S42_00755 [Candidatus Methanomarinus sp.]|jgi:uncharacterized protein YqiB (DUF1249 family)|nr:hypothetical protein C5S42_00755 [ANME-2 cluster archaeon]